jgi:hypothetical protein
MKSRETIKTINSDFANGIVGMANKLISLKEEETTKELQVRHTMKLDEVELVLHRVQEGENKTRSEALEMLLYSMFDGMLDMLIRNNHKEIYVVSFLMDKDEENWLYEFVLNFKTK